MARLYENAASGLTILGGLGTLLATIYYMKNLFFSLGFNSGLINTATAYNLTISSSLLSILPSSSTLSFAVYITYIMIPISLLIFTVGVMWFMNRQQSKMLAVVVFVCALFFAGMAVMLKLNFNFGNSLLEYSPTRSVGYRSSGA